jgi:hypothetical protein
LLGRTAALAAITSASPARPAPAREHIAATCADYPNQAAAQRAADAATRALRGFTGGDPHGRGLAVVDALVTRWGIRRGSTHLWFAMQLDAGVQSRR